MGLEPDAQLVFTDENGEYVCVCSEMPSGTQIHVRVCKKPDVISPEDASFVWDIDTKNDTHELHDNNTRYGQPENRSFGGIRATKGFSSGKHYWTVLFSPLVCMGGVCTKSDEPDSWKLPFCNSAAFQKAFTGTEGTGGSGLTNSVHVGFFLDMDSKVLQMHKVGEPKILLQFEIPDDPKHQELYPCLQMKHVSWLTLTSTSNTPPIELQPMEE